MSPYNMSIASLVDPTTATQVHHATNDTTSRAVAPNVRITGGARGKLYLALENAHKHAMRELVSCIKDIESNQATVKGFANDQKALNFMCKNLDDTFAPLSSKQRVTQQDADHMISIAKVYRDKAVKIRWDYRKPERQMPSSTSLKADLNNILQRNVFGSAITIHPPSPPVSPTRLSSQSSEAEKSPKTTPATTPEKSKLDGPTSPPFFDEAGSTEWMAGYTGSPLKKLAGIRRRSSGQFKALYEAAVEAYGNERAPDLAVDDTSDSEDEIKTPLSCQATVDFKEGEIPSIDVEMMDDTPTIDVEMTDDAVSEDTIRCEPSKDRSIYMTTVGPQQKSPEVVNQANALDDDVPAAPSVDESTLSHVLDWKDVSSPLHDRTLANDPHATKTSAMAVNESTIGYFPSKPPFVHVSIAAPTSVPESTYAVGRLASDPKNSAINYWASMPPHVHVPAIATSASVSPTTTIVPDFKATKASKPVTLTTNQATELNMIAGGLSFMLAQLDEKLQAAGIIPDRAFIQTMDNVKAIYETGGHVAANVFRGVPLAASPILTEGTIISSPPRHVIVQASPDETIPSDPPMNSKSTSSLGRTSDKMLSSEPNEVVTESDGGASSNPPSSSESSSSLPEKSDETPSSKPSDSLVKSVNTPPSEPHHPVRQPAFPPLASPSEPSSTLSPTLAPTDDEISAVPTPTSPPIAWAKHHHQQNDPSISHPRGPAEPKSPPSISSTAPIASRARTSDEDSSEPQTQVKRSDEAFIPNPHPPLVFRAQRKDEVNLHAILRSLRRLRAARYTKIRTALVAEIAEKSTRREWEWAWEVEIERDGRLDVGVLVEILENMQRNGGRYLEREIWEVGWGCLVVMAGYEVGRESSAISPSD